ncbi:MAG: hypothetical protein ACOYB3_00100 [Azonexus sp.]
MASKKRIGETELVRLYQACDQLRTTGTTDAKNIMPSRLEHAITVPDGAVHGKIVVVTVTNADGVYLQQAQEVQVGGDKSAWRANNAVLLTIGQKYAMEGMDTVNRQIATRHF